jgi:uncharacterized protein (TIGR03437 family)
MSFTVIPAAPTLASFNPTSGTVGDAITIAGANLTGATSVKFNGVPALFTVNSANQITATVPTGSSSGLIEITTPGGTTKSNIGFKADTRAIPLFIIHSISGEEIAGLLINDNDEVILQG